MQKVTAAITATGFYVPEDILSNKDLEQMVDTTDEWITTRTGIKERRILKEKGKGSSFLAIKACENLIDKCGLDPKEIDLLIVATATPDMPVASTSAYSLTTCKPLVQVFYLACQLLQVILNRVVTKKFF
jgi:3-oxoacyl-[acyl-carrier-protein] synthase-3